MMTDLFLSIFETTLPVSVTVVLLVLLAPLLRKRYAARWKYRLWIFLALWLLIPFVTAWMPGLPQERMQSVGQAQPDRLQMHHVGNAGFEQITIEIPEQMTAPVAAGIGKDAARLSLLDIAAIVWMIGAIAFFLVHLFGYLHYKARIAKTGTVIEDTAIQTQLLKLRDELHIRRFVPVMESPEASSPMLVGFLHPILVLPDGQYSMEELPFILKHELVHFKRRDVFFKLLLLAANAVHWFNPLIWIMVKEAAVDMELSCDERVVHGADYAVRKAYTETLLSTMHRQCMAKSILTTQFYGGKQIMKKRFRNILSRTAKKNGIAVFAGILVITVSMGTLVGCQFSGQAAKEVFVSNNESSNSREGAQQLSKSLEKVSAEVNVPSTQEGQSSTTDNAPGKKDQDEIRAIIETFSAAYFGGDADTLRQFLSDSYEWDVDVYEENGMISDQLIKGLPGEDGQEIGDGPYEVWLEFKDSNYDNLWYLNLSFVREDGSWKIDGYGLEG